MPRPQAAESFSSSSSGNPSGNVGMGLSEMTPHISQCPMMVSLPRERSVMRAYAPVGAGMPPSMPSMLNSPSFFIFSAENFAERRMEPSVSAPASPKSALSGAVPMPKLSSTIRNTRFINCLLYSMKGDAKSFICFRRACGSANLCRGGRRRDRENAPRPPRS